MRECNGQAEFLMLLAAVLSFPVAAAERRGRPLNFIVAMADDLGAKELSCYGNRDHKTPNLEKLARAGVQFETCYSTPLCHPTRFEIMTGQYGCHNGVYQFAGRPGGPRPDSREVKLLLDPEPFAERDQGFRSYWAVVVEVAEDEPAASGGEAGSEGRTGEVGGERESGGEPGEAGPDDDR